MPGNDSEKASFIQDAVSYLVKGGEDILAGVLKAVDSAGDAVAGLGGMAGNLFGGLTMGLGGGGDYTDMGATALGPGPMGGGGAAITPMSAPSAGSSPGSMMDVHTENLSSQVDVSTLPIDGIFPKGMATMAFDSMEHHDPANDFRVPALTAMGPVQETGLGAGV